MTNTTYEPTALQALAESPEGQALIQKAQEFQQACAAAGLSKQVQIAGAAPFVDDLLQGARAQGFAEGQTVERDRLAKRLGSVLAQMFVESH